MRNGLIAIAGVAILLAGCSAPATYSVRTYRMGDRVEIGSLIYNVFDVKWLSQLGEGASARVPKERFFLVRMSIVNSGGSMATVPVLQVIDSAGTAYSELSDGQDVPLWMGFLRNLRPADTLQGHVVFDVPPAHYKLRVTDDADERVAMVDIPLQFQIESPGVTDPDAAPPPPTPDQLSSPSRSK